MLELTILLWIFSIVWLSDLKFNLGLQQSREDELVEPLPEHETGLNARWYLGVFETVAHWWLCSASTSGLVQVSRAGNELVLSGYFFLFLKTKKHKHDFGHQTISKIIICKQMRGRVSHVHFSLILTGFPNTKFWINCHLEEQK